MGPGRVAGEVHPRFGGVGGEEPLAPSPSNSSALASHSAARTVGTRSLGNR